jgi:predicted MPP superfamily phosphohydrolase
VAAFFITLGIFLLLQIGHSRYLIREFPRLRPLWVRVGLLVFHLPLIGYFLLRLTGNTTLWILEVLRPLARLGFYFQAITIVHLCSAAVGHLLWRRWSRTQDPEPGPEDPSRRAFLRGSATVGAGAALATSLVGAASAFGDPEVTQLDLAFPDLPQGLHGLRIAQLSDLHAGPMISAEVMARWRRALDAQRPDLIVITGDLVDSRPEELFPLLGAFHDIQAPLGVHAILGNHDYFTDPVPIWASLNQAGIGCLENRHVLLNRNGASFALIGLQDPMARNGRFRGIAFGPGPDVKAATQGLPSGVFSICLNHRPSDWPLAKATGARLTLSGHTHGGQINVIPGVNSARFLGPYTGGLYREEGQCLYVSRGLGVVALPMRLNAPPELPVIRLLKG